MMQHQPIWRDPYYTEKYTQIHKEIMYNVLELMYLYIIYILSTWQSDKRWEKTSLSQNKHN